MGGGAMEPRATLHERHHSLHADVSLIMESSLPLEVLERSGGDEETEGKILVAPLMANSAIDPEPGRREAHAHESDVESSPAAPLVAVRSLGEIHKRFVGLPDDMDTLDIMRESSRILRRQSDLFTSLAAALILPISIVILTHVVVTRPVIDWARNRLEVGVFEESVSEALKNPYTKFIYLKISEFLVTSVLYIPLAVTLAALSKAGIVYTVGSTYAGLKVSFMDVMHRIVPRVWIPLAVTYFCACAIFMGTGVIAVLCLGFSNGLFAALHTNSVTILVVFTILGLVFCGIFVYLKVILNVANVVVILEDKHGFSALARSFSVLQGRVEVAIFSYLVTLCCNAFVTLLFEYRVTDKNDYTEHNQSATWEGPLLILLHSFIYLFADIMTTVLYFTCPKATSFETCNAPRVADSIDSLL